MNTTMKDMNDIIDILCKSDRNLMKLHLKSMNFKIYLRNQFLKSILNIHITSQFMCNK